MTLAHGIHVISPDVYHADPCPPASLSSSIAHLLCSTSSAHARAAHPRLNPDFEREEKDHFDLGTAAHSLLLSGESVFAVIDAPDWRKKDAQEQRSAARLGGRLPMLAAHFERVQAMVASAREQLAALDVDPPLFTDGETERTLVWEEEGVTCRARLDWLRNDLRTIDDFKSTGRSASPEVWAKSMFSFGGDVQAAFYRRGVRALTEADARFRFVVQETFPPFALSVIAPNAAVLAIADAKVDYALRAWKRGMETGRWPAYPAVVQDAELPAWEEMRWLEKEAREAA